MILTVDLEFLDRTEDEVKRLLSLLEKYDAKATFFVVASLVKAHRDLIKSIAKVHEVASHSVTHASMQEMSQDEIAKEAKESKRMIESLGVRCEGFRAPYNMPPAVLGGLLKKAGYAYDSSICCTYFPSRYNNRRVRSIPYCASHADIRMPGNSIVEMPISNFGLLRYPALLSFMKLAHPLLRPVELGDRVFSMHDYDLKKGISDTGAGALVRGMQKARSGEKAFTLLESVLRKQSRIVACRDYLGRSKSLLQRCR